MRVRFVLAALACGAAIGGAGGRAAAWGAILSGAVREAPECVSWGADRVDCFARRSNGRLAWLARTQGKWSPPQDLGGDLPVAVSCVVRGPGGINCFAPTAKGVLAEIHLNGSKWSAWSSLGGELAIGRASCVSLGPDRIGCFARGRGGQLMSRAWDGGQAWSEWRNLGGAFSADPACVVLEGARVACFGRGPDGQFVARLPTEGTGASAWVTYGGRVQGRPSCGAVSGTDIACAVRGSDERLYILRDTAIAGRASGRLLATGDAATGDPTCVAAGGGLTCFAGNSERHLLRRTIAASGDMSDGRTLNSAPESTGLACLSIQSGALGCLLSDTEGRIQFAMGGELNGEQMLSETASSADEGPTGDWFLSSLETNAVCRVRLSSGTRDGAKRLEIGSDCDDLPGVSRATQWQADQDLLEFLGPHGRTLARFRLTSSGRWISAGARAAYLLSRDRPEEASNDPPDAAPPDLRSDEGDSRGVVGVWRLTVVGSGESCRIRFTDWPAGGGNAVVLNGPCGAEVRAAQFWSTDKESVVLANGDGQVVARFTRQAPGTWRGESTHGTASYALTR